MTITVAVPTYRRADAVRRCVESLFAQTRVPDEIVIVDSSEDDATQVALAAYMTRIRYIRHKSRLILPIARNRCIEAASTDLIAFIDDDAVAEKTWVRAIVDEFEKHPDLGGVTGPTINATADLVPLEPLIRDSTRRNRILPWGEVRSDSRRWVPPQTQEVTSMPGGNMAFPLALLRDIGGFDEQLDTPSFREETDVEFRILARGKKFAYAPGAYAWHVPGLAGGISDVEDSFALYLYRCGQNHRRVVDKYVPKVLSRLSWLTWSRNPPSLPLAILLSVIRKKNYLAWHRGLWGFGPPRDVRC